MEETLLQCPEPSKGILFRGAWECEAEAHETRNGWSTICRGVTECIREFELWEASGETGILPEMLKVACSTKECMKFVSDGVERVQRPSRLVWCSASSYPQERRPEFMWQVERNSIVGCGWEGGSRVLQGRLQKIAEDKLPESQCGFRKGRGCTDMIFTIRQLVEKSWEHTASVGR